MSAQPGPAPAGGWLASWPGVRSEEPLARHSQLGVGGPAEWFREVSGSEELCELAARCRAAAIPVTAFGAGSNAVVLDGGIRGLVVTLEAGRVSRDALRDAGGEQVLDVGGGTMMPRAALDCARLGLAGLEFGIGIPGTCGASVWGNAGAFGTEVADVLVDCDAVAPGGELRTVAAAGCGFSYRHSRFKSDLAGHVIVAARLRVRDDDPRAVRARVDGIQARRKATQPIGLRSLGSVFKNPPGDHAGRLVEAAGLRGRRRGGAQISPKHGNFIVNVGGALAADILALVELAHDTVLERFGVDLEREIAVLGEPAPG